MVSPLSQAVPQSSDALYLLDYGAGNVRSLANSISSLGYSNFKWVTKPEDFKIADKLIFPGVGSFPSAIASLKKKGLLEGLKEYIKSGKPYFGICVGMQVLFTGSTEGTSIEQSTSYGFEQEFINHYTGIKGLEVIPFIITKFNNSLPQTSSSTSSTTKAVPHMGWNSLNTSSSSASLSQATQFSSEADFYFVHSYAALLPTSSSSSTISIPTSVSKYILTKTTYVDQTFISSVSFRNVLGCQFHPEKSGPDGLALLARWLSTPSSELSCEPWDYTVPTPEDASVSAQTVESVANGFKKRIVACLDVRANDAGDLVVTKGDQYDVREKKEGESGEVRNLGKPVELAERYFLEGADEICFLNITSFRTHPLASQPLLALLSLASERIFVPLTVGGGIKTTVDPDGSIHSALDVADAYFRAGADKVSIGSEAVKAVEELIKFGRESDRREKTGIEMISEKYGDQAVVVSVDPRRIYLDLTSDEWNSEDKIAKHPHFKSLIWGSKAISPSITAEEKSKVWWYACTTAGGRVTTDIDVIQLSQGVESLGCGELLINSIDRDGSNRGFDLDLISVIKKSVGIPIVASSGAGKWEDFRDVFDLDTMNGVDVEAGLAAGIFHRREVGIEEVKTKIAEVSIPVRRRQVKDSRIVGSEGTKASDLV